MHPSRRLAFALLPLALASSRSALAAPSVWAIDDGEKIRRDAVDLPLESGTDNPVWQPGEAIELFALRDEVVAFQVVVEADAKALAGVTVDLDELVGPGGATIANATGADDPTRFLGRRIERFVEHYFDVARPSGNTDRPAESLGWASGSGPEPGAFTGAVPDALVPVEVAPSWSPYPMRIAARSNGVVWIDVTVPRTQPAGMYRGDVVVRAGGAEIGRLPVRLEVVGARMPDRPAKTMLFYGRSELDDRIGAGDAAEKHLWQLLHRHRLVPMHGAKSRAEAQAHLSALDGSIYTAAQGYEGPGEGVGDDVLSLGTYGGFGAPDASDLAAVESIADLLAEKQLLAGTDVFVYAIDESCSSPRGAQWKSLLAGSKDPNAASVRVGWTCSQPPADQPVDLPMVFASAFDPAKVEAARAKGKTTWIYNGVRPSTGTFLTDSEAVSTRVNGWISGMFDVGRWFYWETTFWYDDNPGGHGAYDPFVTAETFHNDDGDYCMGDGVLLYPGRQVDRFTEHSIGMDGVIASIRLKNWRRGVEDAGWLALARAAAPDRADAIAAELLPRVLSDASRGSAPSWSASGRAFFEARKALRALVPVATPDAPDGGAPDAGAGPDAAADGDAGVVPDAGAGGAPGDGGAGDASEPGTAADAGAGEADSRGPIDTGTALAPADGGGCSLAGAASRRGGGAWLVGLAPLFAALRTARRRRRR